MNKTRLVSVALAAGLLVGIAVPAVALSGVDRRQGKRIKALEARADKQSRRISALVQRVEIIENAPDTTTGLADEINQLKDRANNADARLDDHGNSINWLFNRTSNLDQSGVYYGVVRRSQVRLSDGDGCTNSQPRPAIWSGGDLSC